MEQEAVYFGETGTIKSAFHKNKRPNNINEVDIEEIVLSNKKSYSKGSFKYFIGSIIIVCKASSDECIC